MDELRSVLPAHAGFAVTLRHKTGQWVARVTVTRTGTTEADALRAVASVYRR